MLMTEIFAFAAAGLCVVFTSYIAFRNADKGGQKSWLLPAVVSLAFVAFSTWAALTQGPLAFWVEHSARNLWGNQIFFDLLLASSVAWVLVGPRARKVNMSLPLWLAFILATGSIGFLAMLARLLWLEQRAQTKM